MPAEDVRLESFPLQVTDNIRHSDTDLQGHVNNAVFATMLETGRVEMIHGSKGELGDEGANWVLARVAIDFRLEMHWPGQVTIGTRIKTIGKSSVTLEQALFYNGACAASAESVIVQMNSETRRSQALSPAAITKLEALK